MDVKKILIAVAVVIVVALGIGCGTGMVQCLPTPAVDKTAG